MRIRFSRHSHNIEDKLALTVDGGGGDPGGTAVYSPHQFQLDSMLDQIQQHTMLAILVIIILQL